MHSNYSKWLGLKDSIRQFTERLHEVEAEIWLEAEKNNNLNPKGSKTFEDGEFKITITHSDDFKVDQKMAAERPELFKCKYEFSKSEYKHFVASQKDFVDEAITIVPRKPSFKVERKNEI